jgi:YD repeat-containing protein
LSITRRVRSPRRTDTGGSFAFAGHTDQTSIYDHNALNQIIDITETGAVTRTLTPVWTAGNLTSDGERSFGYDPFNRLSSVTGGGQSDVDLGYDPLGRLAELDVSGGLVTRFQYDGEAMIAEYRQRGRCDAPLCARPGYGCAAGAL